MLVRSLVVVVVCVLGLATAPVRAQLGTAFTYQGNLEVSGIPYTGSADFTFSLWSAPSGGTALVTYAVNGVTVTKGVFTVTLDNGTNYFAAGSARYLSMTVKAGSPSFVSLPGRTLLTPAPFAHFATGASTATTLTGVTRNGGNDFGFGATPSAKVHAFSTGNAVLKGESSSTIGTWMYLHNTSANGRNWSLISTGSGNGEGAGKLLINDTTAGGGVRMTFDASGNVGVGTDMPTQKLHVAGNILANGDMTCKVLIVTGGSDLSESYDIAGATDAKPIPGMVVSIDSAQVGKLRVSTGAYDRTVAGIISGANGVAPGLVLNHKGTAADGELPVANAGRVWCYVDADAAGPIVAGDLLTTSGTPGHAMKVTDFGRSNGAIIGKAMSGLEKGKGLVLVLVGLQ